MSKLKVGIVGYRGMVGSELVQRMQAEGDFALIDATLLSTSQAGQAAPSIDDVAETLGDANDLATLQQFDVITSCQGSDYTKQVHPALREKGWQGYWIDAASSLRMEPTSVLALDPVNSEQLETALDTGTKDIIGANCTNSIMLLGIAGLLRADLVEWIDSTSYQAVSGAGAQYVRETLQQMQALGKATSDLLEDPSATMTAIDQNVSQTLASSDFPAEQFGYPIAANILPWIDSDLGNGQSREEWKGSAETNKILGTEANPMPVDGTCIRVGSMRSHALRVHLKIKKDVELESITELLQNAHQWVNVVPNTKEATLKELTPVAVSGTLDIAIGRLRKLAMGPEHIQLVIVGDQLLWGAAEPLRRALRIILDRSSGNTF